VNAPKIRALISVLGLDQHEAGALAISRMLRDAGFEVIYTGRFTLPATIAEVAAQEDVDVVGISAHSWEFLHYAGELMELLGREDPPVPVVVGGSIITEADREQALAAGITEVVRRGATEAEIVETFRRLADRSFRASLDGMTPPGRTARPPVDDHSKHVKG
jgi:methylmalonyl-CoA mutase C-terminal domain/subunit